MLTKNVYPPFNSPNSTEWSSVIGTLYDQYPSKGPSPSKLRDSRDRLVAEDPVIHPTSSLREDVPFAVAGEGGDGGGDAGVEELAAVEEGKSGEWSGGEGGGGEVGDRGEEEGVVGVGSERGEQGSDGED